MSTIFPGSASVGQIYNNYTFDGTAWNINGIDLTENYLEESSASATYLTQVSASNTYITQTSASTTYQPKVANVSDTEIGYLDGVTSAIQTQLNSKANLSGATFTGEIQATKLKGAAVGGDEGGEIFLEKAATNTTLNTGVNIDINQNKLRIFESGGNNRGASLDISTLANGVGSEIAVPGLNGIPYRMAAGSTVINGGSATITLPSNRFSQAPIISVQSRSTSGNFPNTELRTVSSSSFTIGCTKTDFTEINWIAVQMTSGAAGG